MTDLIRLLTLIVLSALTLCAYLVVWQVLAPQHVAHTAAHANAAPIRTAIIGAINLVFFGTLMLGMLVLSDRSNGSPFAALFLVVGAGLLTLLALGLSMGLAAVAQLISARIQPNATPLRQSLFGAGGLILACSTPFVGWLLLLPYCAALGTGAYILHLLSLLSRRKQ